MNSSDYLKSYGWKEGEPLRRGGLKRPILVKHKKDTKGLGHDSGDSEAWWERVFDGALKGLDVMGNAADGITFKQNEIKASAVTKSQSPLYKMFVKGEGLVGTIGKTSHVQVEQIKVNDIEEVIENSTKISFDSHGGVKPIKGKKAKSGKTRKTGKTGKSEKKEDKKKKKKKKEKKEKKSRDESKSKNKKRKSSNSDDDISRKRTKKSIK